MSDKTVNDSGDAAQPASSNGSRAVVWIGDVRRNMELLAASDSDNFLSDGESAADYIARIKRGEPLPADRYPKEFCVQWHFYKIGKLPDFFNAEGRGWLVSSRFADILNQHALGKTSLHPVTLFINYKNDRTEPFPGDYFYIDFSETKDTVDLEKSRDGLSLTAYSMRFKCSREKWNLRSALRDNLVMVSRDALAGVDLWFEPYIGYAFFMSDRLMQALDAAGLAKSLDLYKCAVID